MMIARTSLLAWTLVAACASPLTAQWSFRESPDETVLLDRDGGSWLHYQRAVRSQQGRFPRSHYLHPLRDLDGDIVTEDFPEDHRHHRGIFWAWHQCLVAGEPAGDGWVCRDFSWNVRQASVKQGANRTTIETRVFWKSPDWRGGRDAFVEESSEVVVWRRRKDRQDIDFVIRLWALTEDVRIGGSANAKGYGGFSYRLKMPKNVRFRGPRGDVEPATTAVDAGPWLDITGRFGQSDRVSGVAVLCHSSLPQYPPPWILRRQRSMQNVVFPGRKPVRLPARGEAPLTLRYRLVLHRGEPAPATLNAWHEEYAGEAERTGEVKEEVSRK